MLYNENIDAATKLRAAFAMVSLSFIVGAGVAGLGLSLNHSNYTNNEDIEFTVSSIKAEESRAVIEARLIDGTSRFLETGHSPFVETVSAKDVFSHINANNRCKAKVTKNHSKILSINCNQ